MRWSGPARRTPSGPGSVAKARRHAVPGVHAVLPGLGRPRLARPGRPAAGRAALGPDRRRRAACPAEPDLGRACELPAGRRGAALARWAGVPATGRSPTTRRGRDRPDLAGTSGLSAHLKYGEIHPRTLLADLARRRGAGAADVPDRAGLARVLRRRAVAPAGVGAGVPAARSWPRWPATGRAERRAFDAWREGRTGFPFVDAGMRQLRAEGWMHNRVRMVVACFLVKDLHVEWQHGARHFMRWLRDGDLA